MEGRYHVFVGAETGLLKGLNVNKSKWDNLIDLSSVDRSNEICAMCWENQRQEDSILFGTRGGLVRRYCRQKQSVEDILQVTSQADEVIKGLYKLDSKYVSCTNKGKLCVWQDDQNNEDSNEPLTIDCGDKVSCMSEDPHNISRVSTGGEENCLKIFDLSRPDACPVFKAKNVRDDWLDLRVPIWLTAIGYMPRSSSSLVVTTTRYHQVRVYDPSTAQRRPVIDMEWEEYPIISLCVNPYNDRQLFVGNSVGEQALLDVRNKQCLGKFKGGAGAIRSIQCHPTLPLVLSCGLDRYVRVHDLKTRALTQKFYMKSRLNKLLLVTDWDDEVKEEVEIKEEVDLVTEQADELAEEADDGLWESLDVVGDAATKTASKPKKQKRLVVKTEEPIVKKTKKKQKLK